MKTFITLLLLSNIQLQAEIIIDSFDNIDNLVNSLIDEQAYIDPGVQVSNISYNGDSRALGYFSNGLDAGLGMDSGIVLSTGYVNTIDSVNSSSRTSGRLNTGGDSDLNSLIPGYSTYDATSIEMDFTTQGDSAYFNYAFASEEYTEWVGSSYNDTFGFFINGENYALVPGEDDIVAINSINHNTNEDFFNNNDSHHDPNNNQDFDFSFDGFTNTFTAKLTGLNAGETYHLKLAIADAGDTLWDSAVFLEAGSFSKVPIAPAGAPEPEFYLLIIIAGFILYKKLQQEKSNVFVG
ncbi:choice-of-anchor L domain-containing protein [Lentisphaera profundi]|uniref:Choice-of-anchor L domain-containing protein n=1 Tax=Lentisphaera profundi TaxID=1658616 RepID=A0ABY7VZ53_9BACT|nr:choice-of-anchor L domain-containing protein [Lentisphaera profundi]WDE98549.1 choice-of-anchor L domain-containing protein [Lentisphaera profundi]